MLKYVLKRLALMLLTFVIIMFLCFVLIKSLPLPAIEGLPPSQRDLVEARRIALGYYEPIMTQFWIFLVNVITKWDWGTSWYVDKMSPAFDVLWSRLPPTVLLNIYSLVFSIPLGLLLGIYAALHKNKWQDDVINIVIMLFVSVPSYVYAFLVQLLLCSGESGLGLFPLTVSSLSDAGGSYFSWTMFHSQIPAVLALSFGEIAGLARFLRAELTEALSSEYMLLARAKGLTQRQATWRHAFNNAMVPILPSIIGSFVSIMGGSLIIENIFGVPGVGNVFLMSINMKDYDVYMACNAFYIFIGLLANILVDLSYGFIDPRIRMGE